MDKNTEPTASGTPKADAVLRAIKAKAHVPNADVVEAIREVIAAHPQGFSELNGPNLVKQLVDGRGDLECRPLWPKRR